MSEKIKRYKGEYLKTILGFLINNSWCESSDVSALEQENEELKKKVKILELALKLACDRWGMDKDTDDYIQQAEEELKNE